MIPNLETMGRWIVILGLALTIIGGGIWLIARVTGWDKFPGTIKWQNGNVTMFGSIIRFDHFKRRDNAGFKFIGSMV